MEKKTVITETQQPHVMTTENTVQPAIPVTIGTTPGNEMQETLHPATQSELDKITVTNPESVTLEKS